MCVYCRSQRIDLLAIMVQCLSSSTKTLSHFQTTLLSKLTNPQHAQCIPIRRKIQVPLKRISSILFQARGYQVINKSLESPITTEQLNRAQ